MKRKFTLLYYTILEKHFSNMKFKYKYYLFFKYIIINVFLKILFKQKQ